MKPIQLAAMSLIAVATATPSYAGGDYYGHSEVYIEAPAPRVVARERIIERDYYQPPVVETYIAPRYYPRHASRYRDVYYDGGRYYRRWDDDESWRPTYRSHW